MDKRFGSNGWMKLWAALLLLSFSLLGWAQTYSYRSDTFSYDTPSASATTVAWHTTNASACSSYPNGDDDYADANIASATSPANDFTFTFAGVAYTSLRIYSNGMLTFGTDNSGLWRIFGNSTLPAPAVGAYSGSCPGGTPARVIIPYWTDIVAGTANSTSGASIKYELLGTKPNRRFVISWVNVKLYNTSTRYNFQVILYETPTAGGNSNFKFQYTSGSSTGAAATVGVQVSSTDYTQYSYNQAYIDPTVGTAILWYPSSQFTGKQAEYRFDQGLWNGTAGEVIDTATGTYNAVRTGSAVSSPTGKVCRGGSFPSNTSNATISAVATPIAPTSQGAIDFWYQSNVRWNASGSDAMLFDATTAAARPFYLMKTASGTLRFVVTDSAGTVRILTSTAQSFNAATWQHVGVTWSINPGSNQTVLKIFLNGVEATSTRYTSAAGAITALSSVYIGDNRTSGITPSGGTGNSANGYIDEVNFYNKEINATQAMNDMNATRVSCTSIDHFRIVHAGSVVSCDTASVTIEAHDASHNQISLSGTTINLTTSTNHGNWSLLTGNGAVSNAGSGAASYTFSNEAVVVLGLSNSYAESTNINVAAGTYTEHSGTAASCVAEDYTFGTTCDANLVFTQAGFRFVDSAGNFVSNQVAGTSSGTYYLQAVRNTCTAAGACTGVCSSVFPAGSAVDIGLAYECSDPTSCQSGQTLTFAPGAGAGSAGGIAGNAGGAVSSSAGTYTTRSLTFNATSPNPLPAVPFTFNYTDVGRIRLWARYPATSTSPTVAGSSSLFVVKPYSLLLTDIKQTASPFTANPAAATAAGSRFVRAGENFSATVTAVNASCAANLSSYTLLASLPVACRTPNFGQETAPETVSISSALVAGLGLTNNPGITNPSAFGAFSAGSATGTAFTWDDVGIITLTPALSDGDYLGSGVVGATVSGNVGRFYADHFNVAVATQCAGFVYGGQAGPPAVPGQPFSVTATALNAKGASTPNYNSTSGFAKSVNLSLASGGGSGSLYVDAVAGGNGAIPASKFLAGVGTVAFTDVAGRISYVFSAFPTPSTAIAVHAEDADSASGTALMAGANGTATLRAGRLSLTNAYGSELLPLNVPVKVQQWTASGWTPHVADTCTALTVPSNGNTGLTNTLRAMTTATLLSPVAAGDSRFRLSAPGAGNVGLVDISGSIVRGGNTWLTLSAPTARACFGSCGPRSPVIYFRERY
ncbi:MAG: LamG-like jellyroll fold domain-containing protein [Azonexus sp.]|nr:LamG-like jellyroll fold domain-containing protein [Azonexus sp.]